MLIHNIHVFDVLSLFKIALKKHDMNHYEPGFKQIELVLAWLAASMNEKKE